METTYISKTDGQQYTASARWDPDTRRGLFRRARAHVWCDADEYSDDLIHEYAKEKGLQNAYTTRGEHKDIDKMWAALNKRIVSRKRHVLEETLVALKLDIPPEDIAWSRTAGCGCGCSPGFLIKGGHLYNRNIFVNAVHFTPARVIEDSSTAAVTII